MWVEGGNWIGGNFEVNVVLNGHYTLFKSLKN